MISSFSFSVLLLHCGPFFSPFQILFSFSFFFFFSSVDQYFPSSNIFLLLHSSSPPWTKCFPRPNIFFVFLLRSSSPMWTKYFPPVPSPSLFSSADQLFFSNEQSKTNKGQNINRRFPLFTWYSSKYLSHIQNLYLGMFLCISLHKKPLSMHQQVTRVMYTAARQRIMFETDKWGKTLSIPLVRAHLHPVRQSTYDQRKYENIINVWGYVVKKIVGESGSDGKLHLLQRKDKQFARNNIFCIFWIFTSQDQAFSTSTQHLREFSKKMIKARDPLGDPDVSHHFPGAGKLLLISFSNSRTTQSTQSTSQQIYMYVYIIIYVYEDTLWLLWFSGP